MWFYYTLLQFFMQKPAQTIRLYAVPGNGYSPGYSQLSAETGAAISCLAVSFPLLSTWLHQNRCVCSKESMERNSLLTKVSTHRP